MNNIAGWIITGLLIVLSAVLAIGSFLINHERKQHEREIEKLKQQGAENAQNTADIIAEANDIKNNANTGNHSNDLHTMASQLHDYANRK